MMRGQCIILTDFIQKFVSEVQDGANAAEGEQREVNNLYPLLMQHNGAMESWNKGNNNANDADKSGTYGQQNVTLDFYVLF